MTTTAATWFYNDPEPNPFYIQERVNQTFWQARFGQLWLDCTSATSPYKMSGLWGDVPVEFEWQTATSFILRVPGEAETDSMVAGISRVLALKASLRYEISTTGQMVIEWHADGGNERWQKIQGDPSYRNPERL